jgi:pimeloyl-ACP methyl ester carboxylesterase
MSTTMTTNDVDLVSGLRLTITEAGSGRPALILHGGGGPATVASIGDHLASTMHPIIPTHPGWNGTDRPERLASIADYAVAYLAYLSKDDLRDVVVIGSSLGGWIAAEMAVRDDDGRIGGLILIDAMGIDVEGEAIQDFFALDARGVAEHAYHDPDRFFVDPATVPAEQVARQRANMATMRIVASEPYMHDPTLRARLGRVAVPTLVIWGDSDRIATPAYGAAYADAFGAARFEVVRDAGHLPQIEQPAVTFALIDDYLAARR